MSREIEFTGRQGQDECSSRFRVGIIWNSTKECIMAQKVQVVLVDDLDGGSADETVTFSLDGVSYEIDLSHDNAAALRDAMASYVGHGRRIGSASRRGGSRRSPAGTSTGGTNPAEIRDWAKREGIEVNERGRISADLLAKFRAAHP
jgi:hypothetical protein